MGLRYIEDPGYSLGMIRDQPSWQIPTGGVYDQLNMLNDKPGIARHRGGSTALVSGAQTAFATSIGFAYSQDATTIEELYGLNGKTGVASVINKTTGAATTIGTPGIANSIVGRPVRHFGFLVFPTATNSLASTETTSMAGQTSSTTSVNGLNATITAGNKQITLTPADNTTNVKVGAIVTARDAYVGRVVSIDSATTFSVWPVPTQNAIVAGGNLTFNPALSTLGGACGASFQNRLLYGNSWDVASYLSTGTKTREDRRVNYSVLPTERGIGATGQVVDGAVFLYSTFSPTLNYFYVPGADPIVAMEPVSDNQLLILTGTRPVIFSGNLATQLSTTSQTVTFDISPVNTPAGCLSDLSVQRTSRGIVWAGADGVYAWDGREPVNLTGDDKTRRIASYWQALASDAATFVIHGSAYVRDHYVVSGTSGGVTFSLACNVRNLQWTRLSGVGTDLFYGLARPSVQQQVFAARWWDQAGAAPSMTNGQTLRLESMLAPYTTGATKTDADGTAVAMSLTTRVITGDAETQKTFIRGTLRAQVSSTTAGVTFTGQSKIDAADISAASVRALGNLSNTAVLTVSNATNANPIVVTTGTHGLQSDDFVDIDGVTGNTNANGRWRIAVINATSFSLVGGIGNGAFGGSPTCKKLTETDYQMSPLNAGQGASFTIAGSPNNIEIHGVRLAVLEKQPVMST